MHIKDLKLKLSQAWDGSRHKEDSKYYTDGAVLLLRSACKRKPYKRMITEGSLYKVAEESIDKLFSPSDKACFAYIHKIQPRSEHRAYGVEHIAWLIGCDPNTNGIALDAQRVKLVLGMIPDAEFYTTDEQYPERYPIEIHSHGELAGLIMSVRIY